MWGEVSEVGGGEWRWRSGRRKDGEEWRREEKNEEEEDGG